MSLEVKVEGLDKLIEKLTLATAEETLNPALLRGGYFLKQWISENRFITGGGSGKTNPRKLTSRSGNLLGSIAVTTRQKFEVILGTNKVYARIHEFGGVISPGAKGFLAWKGPDGKYIFTQKPVKIPARPYMRPAIENKENINKITVSINKAIQEALSK